MDKQRSAEMLKETIDFIGITYYELSKELGYKSTSSIYHIKDGLNNISNSLAQKIVARYPQVNYLFLMGKEPNVEATNERIITQQNVAESTNDFEQTKMIKELLEEMKALKDEFTTFREFIYKHLLEKK